MISSLVLACRKSGSLFSHAAMAVALAGGAAIGTAAIAPAVYAQDYSRDFVAAYEPVAALTAGETPDWAAARAQYETVVAAIETEDDRDAAGNLALQIGNGLNDPAMQRRGLELRLASGKVAPERIGQFQFFVGNLAYNAQDWGAARTALNAALAAGYTENDPKGLVLETYLQEGAVPQAVEYLEAQIGELQAAGQPVPRQWMLRTLAEAYEGDFYEPAVAVSKLLVQNDPTQSSWINSLQVIGALRQLDTDVELDLLRLMRETNSLTQRVEYVRFIEGADPRIMSNEVLPVLAEGLAADHFDTSDPYYVEVKSIADSRAPADRRNPDATASEGLSGDSIDAMASGDVLWSLGDYARAEELYQAAADKGGDANAAMTRKGMAQVKQGKYAEAIATLETVTGEREAIAEMWAIYAATMMN